MSSTKKLFSKHYVKRNPQSLAFLTDEKGNPVVGEKIREVTLHPGTADELMSHWEQSGFVFVEIERKKAEKEVNPQTAMIDSMKKPQLIEFAEQNGLPVEGGVKELKESIKSFIQDQE